MHATDVGMMILANVPAFYYGTSPNKFFDYIATGLPVLNNYPGWLADIIGEHNCGIAVPPDSPVDFASALIELCNNPEKRREMGLNSRILAERKFGRNELASKFEIFLASQVR
jgi:glycosyltransferase involved in cell wall biosynthesis